MRLSLPPCSTSRQGRSGLPLPTTGYEVCSALVRAFFAFSRPSSRTEAVDVQIVINAALGLYG